MNTLQTECPANYNQEFIIIFAIRRFCHSKSKVCTSFFHLNLLFLHFSYLEQRITDII